MNPPTAPRSLPQLCLGLALMALFALRSFADPAANVPPVLDEPVPSTGLPKVIATVPIAKALVMPITAYDADGDPLTFTVSSSNPAIMVRVRTGNPLLRLTINHAAGSDPVADPAYSGVMVFQLFRDWTPRTVGFMSGFAQAGIFTNTKLQRLADLNGADDLESFIYQGGASLSLNFENEFKAPLIFSGRGQLAMANAGASNFRGTNGSQFFITNGNLPLATSDLGGPRHLDFKHTIFGQLTHGWDLMEKLHVTPTTVGDTPDKDVTITAADILTNYDDGTHVYTDAVLMLSATAPGKSTITVSVSDGKNPPVIQTFTATAKRDTHNSLPFITPPPSAVGPKNKIFSVPLPKAIDLEYDYISRGAKLIDSPAHGQYGQLSDAVLLRGFPEYEGRMTVGLSVAQYDMSYRGSIDGAQPGASDSLALEVGVGDSLPKTKTVELRGSPSVTLSNVVVGSFIDGDNHGGGAGAFTGRINWGDGSSATTATIVADPSLPVFAAAVVKGSHTYTKAGVYVVTVDLTGNKGVAATLRSTAVISSQTLVAVGEAVEFAGRTLSQRILATFTDSANVAGDSYSATIDWGDGIQSPGIIQASRTGGYVVLGVHSYTDAESFSLRIRVHKTGTASTLDSTAWSTLHLTGFSGPKHLPPFAVSHLIAEISPITGKTLRTIRGSGANQQAIFTCQMVVLNSGTLPSKPGKLHFYLSTDRQRIKGEPANPQDIPLSIGRFPEFTIPALQPGAGIRFICDVSGTNDLRLVAPVGQDGSGYNLLGLMTYSDPIADYEPIDMAAVYGPFGNLVSVSPTSLQMAESEASADHTKSFAVSISRQPEPGKKCVIKVVSNLPKEITVSSVIDVTPTPVIDPDTHGKASVMLEFTAANWTVPQEVTLTSYDDHVADGTKSVNVAVAIDPSTTDLRFFNSNPSDVTVVNRDSSPKAIVTPTTLTTTEGDATLQKGEFSVSFDQLPEAGTVIVVKLAVANVDTNNPVPEGSIDTQTLTFTETNATTPQKVTFTANDDSKPDGDQKCTVLITVDSTLTLDPRFQNLDPADVAVTVHDNEPKMTVSPLTLTTTESAGAAPVKFSVKLSQLPSADVTVTVHNNDTTEGSIDTTTLTFTPTNATTPQFVTVTGVDDALVDGPQTYTIDVNASTSADPRFNGMKGASVTVTNLDDD